MLREMGREMTARREPTLRDRRRHTAAVLQALVVTFLWSTSWVLIKIGLEDLPPLVFAGLRYVLASWILLLFLLRHPERRRELRRLDGKAWRLFAALGLVTYSLTQGAQFVALGEIPAVTVSLVLSATPAFVALLSIPLLAEPPSRLQWLGIAVFFAGAWLYLGVAGIGPSEAFGLAVAVLGMAANGASAILGRWINRDRRSTALAVTAVSMTVGSTALLIAGLAVEKLPVLSLQSWIILGWLAVVNTALAFTLWNHTLRRLTATESSVINNTMLIQIAILAWFFLGESLGGRQIVGVLGAALGALLVQLRRHRSRPGGCDRDPAA